MKSAVLGSEFHEVSGKSERYQPSPTLAIDAQANKCSKMAWILLALRPENRILTPDVIKNKAIAAIKRGETE